LATILRDGAAFVIRTACSKDREVGRNYQYLLGMFVSAWRPERAEKVVLTGRITMKIVNNPVTTLPELWPAVKKNPDIDI
jgi:hypothetical protein